MQVHSELVRFRANPALIASAQRRAHEQGATLSEYLRNILRRDLGKAPPQ